MAEINVANAYVWSLIFVFVGIPIALTVVWIVALVGKALQKRNAEIQRLRKALDYIARTSAANGEDCAFLAARSAAQLEWEDQHGR